MPTSNPSVHLSVVAEPSAIEDPVPPAVRAVIELYGSQLAKVAFPEIDAASLRRQADELRGEAKAVAKAREQLDTALTSFAARMAVLGDTTSRAIAYARIYSEAHPDRAELSAALAAMTAPAVAIAGAGAAAKPVLTANGKRRGRPPKRSAELFDDAAAREASAVVDAALDGEASGAHDAVADDEALVAEA